MRNAKSVNWKLQTEVQKVHTEWAKEARRGTRAGNLFLDEVLDSGFFSGCQLWSSKNKFHCISVPARNLKPQAQLQLLPSPLPPLVTKIEKAFTLLPQI